MKLNNQYFILRHGETIYQTKKKEFVYSLDTAQIGLTKSGKKKIKAQAKKLKKKKIDLIFASDFFRTRQTSEIVAKELGLKVNFNSRLRDINLGVYHGRAKKEFYRDFPREAKKRFYRSPLKGESWNDVKKRVLNFMKEIDKKYKNKRILIVSHGDPLWLLEGIVKRLNNNQLLKQIFEKKYIKTGELRHLL